MPQMNKVETSVRKYDLLTPLPVPSNQPGQVRTIFNDLVCHSISAVKIGQYFFPRDDRSDDLADYNDRQ